MEMAQENYCHALQFQVILSIILTPRNWSQQRAVRELAAIFELIATVILSIILTAPHSEVLPKIACRVLGELFIPQCPIVVMYFVLVPGVKE